MVHNNEDAMNKIPLKSSNGLDDEEKSGGEFLCDTAAAEEARREQMRANILVWMKKLTIVLICFIGLALISYVIISLCFSDKSGSSSSNSSDNSGNSSEIPSIAAVSTHTSDATGGAQNHPPNTVNKAGFVSNSSPELSQEEKKTITGESEEEVTTTSVEPGKENINQTTPAPASIETTSLKPTQAKTVHLKDEPPISPEKFASTLDVYENAAVCSDKQVCSRIGSNILEQGGSAVDSAIATLLCNGITTSHSMGIGGGMVMNVYIKDSKRGYSIDAREMAPYGSEPDMFKGNKNASLHGGLAIAVPGELMGYHRAHERFGKISWKKLVEPSIQLCEEGFYLGKHQHYSVKLKWNQIKTNEVFKEMFVNETTGELHPVGTKIKPPKTLCETYKMLSENGPTDFYNGSLAKLVAEDLKDLGSTITSDDLETYGADLVSSVTMQLGDDILYSVPPISSGTVVSHILSILEGFNFTKNDLYDLKHHAQLIHRFAEAFKFGFAKRYELGDLRYVDARELVSQLTNPEFSAEIRSKINDSTVLKSIYDYGAQFMGTDDFGTSHTVVLAPNGDAVSVTSSVNHYFGSGQIGKRTGIVFNSGMNDFSTPGQNDMFGLPPARNNFIDERKRAMSSMSPMILTNRDGAIKMIVGAAGGSKIISSVVQVMARVLWLDQNIKEAIDAPRFHHQLLPNVLEYENGHFSEEILKILKSKGHEVKPYKDIGSVVCGVYRNETAIYANADFRKQGGTAGF